MAPGRRLRLRRSSTRPATPTRPPSRIWEIIQAEARRDPPRRVRAEAVRDPMSARRAAGAGRRRGRRRPAGAHLQLPPAARARRRAAPGSLLLVPYGRRLALGYLLPGGSGGREPEQELKRGRGGRLGTDADARPARAGRGDRDLLPRADRHHASPRCCRPASSPGSIGAGVVEAADCLPGRSASRCGRRRGEDQRRRLQRLAPRRGRDRLARTAASLRGDARRTGRCDRRRSRRVASALLRAAAPDAEPPACARRCSGRSSRRWATASGRCRTWPRSSDVDAGVAARAGASAGGDWRRVELDWRDRRARPAGASATRAAARPRPGRGATGRARRDRGTRRRAASCCWRASPRRARPTCTSRRIDATLAAGGAAIVLVPEVSLMPQLADRLRVAGRRRAGGPALRPLGGGAAR